MYKCVNLSTTATLIFILNNNFAKNSTIAAEYFLIIFKQIKNANEQLGCYCRTS